MTSNVSRRSVAKGAAWSIPAVAVASSAPAMAASSTTGTACQGGLIFIPWNQQYANLNNTTGHDGMNIPYVAYASTTSSGSVAYTEGAVTQVTTGDSTGRGNTAYAPVPNLTNNNPGGSGQYAGGASCTDAVCFGQGQTISITMTELSGPTNWAAPSASLARGATNAPPALEIYDGFDVNGNTVGGCGNFLAPTSYSSRTSDAANVVFGTPGGTAANPTWTWVLTMQNPTCNNGDGCPTINVDIWMPSNVPGTATNPISWNITTTTAGFSTSYTTTPHK